MDVEKTIELMLEREARRDARLDEITELVRQNSAQIRENSAQIRENSAQINKLGSRFKEMEADLAKTDKHLKAAALHLDVGMKRLIKLTEAQQRTERKLDRFIDSLSKRSPNGRR